MNPDSVSPDLVERDRRFTRYAALLLIAIGVLVSFAWIISNSNPDNFLSGLRSMKLNSAVAITFIGIALLFQPTRPEVARGMAILAGVIGLVTVIQYVFGWNFGIDELIFKDTFNVTSPTPGRMSPITAINLCLISTALLLIYYRLYGLAQAFALVSGFLSLLALTGHLYGVETLYRLSNSTSMALHTAISCVIAGQAVLASISDKSFVRITLSTSAGGVILRRLAPAVILLPIFLGWLCIQGERAGKYDAYFALALFVLSSVVVFFGLIIQLGWRLHHVDIERQQVLSAVEQARDALEERVLERTAKLEDMNSQLGAQIFERLRAEKEASDKERLLRLLMDNLPETITVKDNDSRYLMINKSAIDDFGLQSEQAVIGKSVFDFQPKERAEKLFNDEQRVMAEGQARFDEELQVYNQRRGEMRWYSLSKIPLHDEQGQVMGLISVSRDVTESRQAATALFEQRNLLRTLVDSLPENIFVKDLESRFLMVNKATLAELGAATEADVIGKTDFDFHKSEHAQQFRAEETEIMTTGQAKLNYEEVVYDKAFGAERWLSTDKIPLRDENGQVTGLVGVNHDVTERRQLETALKALHEITIELTNIETMDEFYRRAVELGRERLGFDRLGLLLYNPATGMANGTYGTDATGSVVDEHDIELDPDDLTSILSRAMGKDDMFAVDDQAQLFNHFQPIGTGWNAVAILWNGTEKLGWLATDNGVQHQPKTKLLLNMLALYAVTLGSLLAQKQTRLAFQQSEEHFRSLLETAPDAIVIVDQDGHIVLINTQTELVFGYTRDELIGKPIDILIPESFRSEHPDYQSEFLANSAAGNGLEVNAQRKDGSQFPVDISLSPIKTDRGTLVTSVIRDITERKHAESQRLEMELDREKMRLLDRFITDASHDLRTPITVMKTSLHIIRRVTDPQKQAIHIARLEEELEKIHRLIEDLFMLSRLDSGATVVEPRPGDLNILAEIVGDSQREAVAQHKHTLLVSLEPGLPKTMLDQMELATALNKLVTNACNYTPDGGKISIETHTEDGKVVFMVRDNGIGIPPDELPRIFERFYRVDKARQTKTGGSGLGLSIAKKIVEAHNGEILVESTPGEGSVFRVLLPVLPPTPKP